MKAAVVVALVISPIALAGLTQEGKGSPGDQTQWLTHSGDVTGQRHSPLTQISPANASQLRPVWTFQTSVLGKWESSPLVIDGVIYATGPENSAWAIEAKTGRSLWRY
ncbi:MAG TPA: hypothetical protein VHJ77_03215, partial [Vicinamibacterales bacterium]|nr:hypothetical protein [Vicinamibacterales bacterium]